MVITDDRSGSNGPVGFGVVTTRGEMAKGFGTAEQCWECHRVYCDQCYPSRNRNSCVCCRGRDAVRRIGGATFRGSMRLVKVRYRDAAGG